jgi:PilZ domain
MTNTSQTLFKPIYTPALTRKPVATLATLTGLIRKDMSEPAVEARAKENRRHPRFDLPLLGRFMRPNKQEYSCMVRNISIGGAAFNSPESVIVGERIVVYLDFLGGVEGPVVRTFDGGFAIKFSATLHKREKLAAQITWYLNRDLLDAEEARRPGHERLQATNKSMELRLADGRAVQVAILDVSISGASIGIEDGPAVGTEVKLGNLRARVMRHHAEGVGLMFLDVQTAESLRLQFG